MLGTLWTPDTRAQLDQLFDCHCLAPVREAERAAWPAAAGPRVRGVLTTGVVGLDAVPRALLANTPDVSTDDVADLSVGRLRAAVRRLPTLDRYVRSAQWQARVPLAHARSLKCKVAGIVGYGRIGQAVARRLEPFGLETRYFQRSPGPQPRLRSPSLLALARDSDMLVVCTPGGAATSRPLSTSSRTNRRCPRPCWRLRTWC